MADVRVVGQHGRQAWEVGLPPASYEPLCPCCALLLSERLEDSGLGLREQDSSSVHPDAHRVQIDVATGVCVSNEQLGGTRDGAGHDITIEAVDERMGDELFPEPPPSRWARMFDRR